MSKTWGFFLVAQDMVLSHRAKFQLIINFLWVKAISTGLQGWTEEEFEIAEAFTDNPPYYKIKDLRGTVLEGTFYDHELQKVVKNDNVYKIESIFKKRKRKKHQDIL